MRFRAPFRSPDKKQRWTSIQKLIVLTWAFVIVPRLIQTLTAPKYRLSVGDAAGAAYTPLAGLANSLLRYVLLGYCIYLVLSRVRHLPAHRLASLAALLAPWVYLLARDLLNQRGLNVAGVVYGVLVVAVWAVQPRIADLRLLASLVVLTALIAMVVAVVWPGRGLFTAVGGSAIEPEKAILPFGVLVGMLTQGNNLGQLLSIGSPGVLLLPRRQRLPALLIISFALVWTASRSSLIATVAWLLVVMLVASVAPPVRPALAGLSMVAAVAAVVLPPLINTDDGAFTNRGYIWRLSLQAWQQSPVFGLGSDWYSRVGGSSSSVAATAYHGHNELVQILVTGGWVLLVLTTVLLSVLITVAARWAGRGQFYPLGFTIALLVSCTFEVSLGFVDRTFLLPFVVLPLAVFLLSPASDPGLPPAQTAPDSGRNEGDQVASEGVVRSSAW